VVALHEVEAEVRVAFVPGVDVPADVGFDGEPEVVDEPLRTGGGVVDHQGDPDEIDLHPANLTNPCHGCSSSSSAKAQQMS
jgi:hypothetical protein